MFQGTKTKKILHGVNGTIQSDKCSRFWDQVEAERQPFSYFVSSIRKFKTLPILLLKVRSHWTRDKMTRAAASRHCAYVSIRERIAYPAQHNRDASFPPTLSDVDPSRSEELCKSLGLWNYRDVKVGNAFMKGLRADAEETIESRMRSLRS